MAATKAKKEGKDPTVAAKAMVSEIAKAGGKAGIKPGPKNVVSATAHMAKEAGHNPKKAAAKAANKIVTKAKKAGVAIKSKSAPVKSHKSEGLHVKKSEHDTVVKPGTPGPKAVVRMAAEKAKKAGKDPTKAAKAVVDEMKKAGGKAGIKPGPKQVVKHAAELAKA
jgi:hypothetical protein